MNVAFRVDASSDIGTGHFMRCLCLADALRRRGANIRFLSRRLPGFLEEMLTERSYELASLDGDAEAGSADLAHSHWLGTTQRVDAEASARALATGHWDWIVVDHYALDERWEATLRTSAKHLFVVDDLADRRHDCDVLLDHNLHANPSQRYAGKVTERCRLLLGPRYALLRDEFRRARHAVSARTGRVARVLVSFGGGDAENGTRLAIDALAASGLDIPVVDVTIGAHHQFRRDIESACARRGFRCHVQTPDMAGLMAGANLAVGAGGVTTWERCCMGLPALVWPIAENQRDLVAHAALRGLVYAPAEVPLTASDIALHLRALTDNPRLREMISRNGLQAVDGHGAERTARAMDRDSISVRAAMLDDAVALFEWRNDESVRTASRHPAPISWPAHETWLRAALADDGCVLLIGERAGAPVGVVRFNVEGARAEVSIYRVPGSGEPGLGSHLLMAAEKWLATRRPDVAAVTAEVLAGNERSHQLFLSSGYTWHSSLYEKSLQFVR